MPVVINETNCNVKGTAVLAKHDMYIATSCRPCVRQKNGVATFSMVVTYPRGCKRWGVEGEASDSRGWEISDARIKMARFSEVEGAPWGWNTQTTRDLINKPTYKIILPRTFCIFYVNPYITTFCVVKILYFCILCILSFVPLNNIFYECIFLRTFFDEVIEEILVRRYFLN